YDQIGIIESPALSGEVAFTDVGFNHLIRKRRRFRTRNERNRRFALLKYARRIIADKQATILYRQEHFHSSVIHFWAFSATIDTHDIKVVVSQIDDGKKQFLSIMEDYTKQKSPS